MLSTLAIMIHQTKNKPCVCKILPWHSLPCPPFRLLNAMIEGAYTSNEKGSLLFLFPHTDYCVRTWVPKSRTPSVWFLMFIYSCLLSPSLLIFLTQNLGTTSDILLKVIYNPLHLLWRKTIVPHLEMQRWAWEPHTL